MYYEARPVNIPGVAGANKCQDCHMRDVTGKGCNKADAPVRPDLPLHDLTGGNSWIMGILASADMNNAALYDPYNYAILSGAKYPGAMIDMTGITGWGTKLQAGKERAVLAANTPTLAPAPRRLTRTPRWSAARHIHML